MFSHALTRYSLLILCLFCTISCASTSSSDDPYEDFNRSSFRSNVFFDDYFIAPTARAYRYITPEIVRDKIANVISNTREPIFFINNFFQAEFGNSATSLYRLAINSTIGIGGMWDVADSFNLPQKKTDFGETLYVWGVEAGPYIILPIIGPSTMRDAFGTGVDIAMSPWQYIALAESVPSFIQFEASYLPMRGLITREQNLESVAALKQGTLDFYAATRAAYIQYRNHQLGIKAEETVIPDFNSAP